DRLALERILTARPERLIALHQEHARADALELDDPAGAAGAAVESDVVRPETGREPGREQEVGVEPADLEEHRAGPLMPVERNEAVDLPHPARPVFDRRNGATAAAPLPLLGRLSRDGGG